MFIIIDKTKKETWKQEHDKNIAFSIGLLVLPRVSAGKFLHNYLAPYLGFSLEGRGSKLRVLSLLVVGLMLGLKPVARATQVTDQNYIWGLPF